MRTPSIASSLLLGLLVASATLRAASAPLIQNQRVTVWDVAAGAAAPSTTPSHDVVTILIHGQQADVRFQPRGAARTPIPADARAIVIELQDTQVPALVNTSGYPLAFPRPGGRAVLENGRVMVWDFTWTPGQATMMHFHDKDVVVTYLTDGALTSTDVRGQSVVNEHHVGYAKFNRRDRVHTETLTRGQGRAIIVELK